MLSGTRTRNYTNGWSAYYQLVFFNRINVVYKETFRWRDRRGRSFSTNNICNINDFVCWPTHCWAMQFTLSLMQSMANWQSFPFWISKASHISWVSVWWIVVRSNCAEQTHLAQWAGKWPGAETCWHWLVRSQSLSLIQTYKYTVFAILITLVIVLRVIVVSNLSCTVCFQTLTSKHTCVNPHPSRSFSLFSLQ